MNLRLFKTFISRDMSIELAYRFNLVMKTLSVFLQMLIFYFLSSYLNKPEYFAFVIVGLMFSKFFQFSVSVFSEIVRQEQYWGTMESLMLYPGTPVKIITVSALVKLLTILAELAIYITISFFVFKINIASNILFLIPVLAANWLLFSGLGLFSAAFILYYKRGDPVNWLLTSVIDLLSGVYFSVLILPAPLLILSKYLPTTHALEMWRRILLDGNIPSITEFFSVFIFSAALFAAGVLIFNFSIGKTKLKGDIGNY